VPLFKRQTHPGFVNVVIRGCQIIEYRFAEGRYLIVILWPKNLDIFMILYINIKSRL